MNVTFIVTKLDLNGGGEKFDILLTAQALQENGHRVRVITVFSELNNISQAVNFSVSEERAKSKGLIALQILVVRILKKYAAQTDIFYLIGSSFIFGSGWYRLFTSHSKPVVAHLNGYANFAEAYFKQAPLWPPKYLNDATGLVRGAKHKIRLFLERSIGVYLVNKLDAITIMSEATAYYYRRAGIRPAKISILYSFHDIATLQKEATRQNPFLKFPSTAFHILSVGRIYIDKGVDFLVKAFAEARLPNAILHIIGAGPQKNELENFVNKQGLSHAIKFYPWQDHDTLIAFYQYSRLFVYPARLPESMVRTSVEAMALGVPLVVPDTGAAAWIPEVAKIFKNGDAADLRAQLEAAYSDIKFQNTAAERGKKLALKFDYRRSINQLDQILKKATPRSSEA